MRCNWRDCTLNAWTGLLTASVLLAPVGAAGALAPGDYPDELRKVCAAITIPLIKTYTRYDLAIRTVVVMWRDAPRRRNFEVSLPYEPETGFRGCSASARMHLRHVHFFFEQVDQQRANWLERAKALQVDPVEFSRRWPAVLYFGSLQENCARYKPLRPVDNVGIDPQRGHVISGWWEPELNQNVSIRLPYEPKTGFAGCSKEAQALLRTFQETLRR